MNPPKDDEEHPDDEFLWDGPAEAVAAALDHLQALSQLLRPILAELENHQDAGRQVGKGISVYLQVIGEELTALLKYLKETAL